MLHRLDLLNSIHHHTSPCITLPLLLHTRTAVATVPLVVVRGKMLTSPVAKLYSLANSATSSSNVLRATPTAVPWLALGAGVLKNEYISVAQAMLCLFMKFSQTDSLPSLLTLVVLVLIAAFSAAFSRLSSSLFEFGRDVLAELFRAPEYCISFGFVFLQESRVNYHLDFWLISSLYGYFDIMIANLR